MMADRMIGVSTIFYGFRPPGVADKVHRLIEVFESVGMPPLIQLNSAPGEALADVVMELNGLREEFGVHYSIHQSMWLPHDDFYLNLASPDPEMRRNTREALKKSITFAQSIGADNVSFHPGCAGHIVSPAEEFVAPEVVDLIPYEEAYAHVKRSL